LSLFGGILTPHGNVYAPLYRQTNGINLGMGYSAAVLDALAEKTPYDYISEAFEYYLNHVNKGERPFILFGHSQGAFMVRELVAKFLSNPKFSRHNKNHIITYAIGISVTQEQINRNPALKFSQRFDDTGVLVTWNAHSEGEIEELLFKDFIIWNPGALVTNPITWMTNEMFAPASVNGESAIIIGPPGTPISGFENNYVGARIDKENGVLVVTLVNPNEEEKYPAPPVPLSRYHGSDISFFYGSIQKNIGDRINAFMGMVN